MRINCWIETWLVAIQNCLFKAKWVLHLLASTHWRPITTLQSPDQEIAEALFLYILRSETWVAGCLHGNISECKFCSFSDHLPRLASIWYYQKVMGRSLVPCEVPLLQDEKETHQLLVGQNPTTSLSMEDPPQNVQITLYLKELLDFFHELGWERACHQIDILPESSFYEAPCWHPRHFYRRLPRVQDRLHGKKWSEHSSLGPAWLDKESPLGSHDLSAGTLLSRKWHATSSNHCDDNESQKRLSTLRIASNCMIDRHVEVTSQQTVGQALRIPKAFSKNGSLQPISNFHPAVWRTERRMEMM